MQLRRILGLLQAALALAFLATAAQAQPYHPASDGVEVAGCAWQADGGDLDGFSPELAAVDTAEQFDTIGDMLPAAPRTALATPAFTCNGKRHCDGFSLASARPPGSPPTGPPFV